MNILITGFEPFDDTLNASQMLVESLRADLPEPLGRLQHQLHFLILPVHTERTWPLLREQLERLRPEICLLTGQARGRDRICLERVALNLKDFERPDTAGNRPRGELIVNNGPDAYWSTLPEQHRLLAELTAAGVPASLSNHAGSHLCNQTLYQSLHFAREAAPDIRCGFVHVPVLPRQAETDPAQPPNLPLDILREAMTILVRALTV